MVHMKEKMTLQRMKANLGRSGIRTSFLKKAQVWVWVRASVA